MDEPAAVYCAQTTPDFKTSELACSVVQTIMLNPHMNRLFLNGMTVLRAVLRNA
jgi:hypothetical protein